MEKKNCEKKKTDSQSQESEVLFPTGRKLSLNQSSFKAKEMRNASESTEVNRKNNTQNSSQSDSDQSISEKLLNIKRDITFNDCPISEQEFDNLFKHTDRSAKDSSRLRDSFEDQTKAVKDYLNVSRDFEKKRKRLNGSSSDPKTVFNSTLKKQKVDMDNIMDYINFDISQIEALERQDKLTQEKEELILNENNGVEPKNNQKKQNFDEKVTKELQSGKQSKGDKKPNKMAKLLKLKRKKDKNTEELFSQQANFDSSSDMDIEKDVVGGVFETSITIEEEKSPRKKSKTLEENENPNSSLNGSNKDKNVVMEKENQALKLERSKEKIESVQCANNEDLLKLFNLLENRVGNQSARQETDKNSSKDSDVLKGPKEDNSANTSKDKANKAIENDCNEIANSSFESPILGKKITQNTNTEELAKSLVEVENTSKSIEETENSSIKKGIKRKSNETADTILPKDETRNSFSSEMKTQSDFKTIEQLIAEEKRKMKKALKEVMDETKKESVKGRKRKESKLSLKKDSKISKKVIEELNQQEESNKNNSNVDERLGNSSLYKKKNELDGLKNTDSKEEDVLKKGKKKAEIQPEARQEKKVNDYEKKNKKKENVAKCNSDDSYHKDEINLEKETEKKNKDNSKIDCTLNSSQESKLTDSEDDSEDKIRTEIKLNKTNTKKTKVTAKKKEKKEDKTNTHFTLKNSQTNQLPHLEDELETEPEKTKNDLKKAKEAVNKSKEKRGSNKIEDKLHFSKEIESTDSEDEIRIEAKLNKSNAKKTKETVKKNEKKEDKTKTNSILNCSQTNQLPNLGDESDIEAEKSKNDLKKAKESINKSKEKRGSTKIEDKLHFSKEIESTYSEDEIRIEAKLNKSNAKKTKETVKKNEKKEDKTKTNSTLNSSQTNQLPNLEDESDIEAEKSKNDLKKAKESLNKSKEKRESTKIEDKLHFSKEIESIDSEDEIRTKTKPNKTIPKKPKETAKKKGNTKINLKLNNLLKNESTDSEGHTNIETKLKSKQNKKPLRKNQNRIDQPNTSHEKQTPKKKKESEVFEKGPSESSDQFKVSSNDSFSFCSQIKLKKEKESPTCKDKSTSFGKYLTPSIVPTSSSDSEPEAPHERLTSTPKTELTRKISECSDSELEYPKAFKRIKKSPIFDASNKSTNSNKPKLKIKKEIKRKTSIENTSQYKDEFLKEKPKTKTLKKKSTKTKIKKEKEKRVKDEAFKDVPVEIQEKVKNLTVSIPFNVCRLHQILDRTGRTKPEQIEQIEREGLRVKLGPFTAEETRLLKENFEDFCKMHDLDVDAKPFLKMKNGLLQRSQQILFLRYLGKDLDNRLLNSIYLRFKAIYGTVGVNRGKFTKEEDEFILKYMRNPKVKNYYQYIGKKLNRTKFSIQERYNKLIAYGASEKFHWINLKDEFVEELLNVTDCLDIEELRKRKISTQEWKEMGRAFGVPRWKVKQAWYCCLYHAVFAPGTKPSEQRRLIMNRLIELGYDDWKLINWKRVAKTCPGYHPAKVYSIFKDMVYRYVSERNQKSLLACLQELQGIANLSSLSIHGSFRRKVKCFKNSF